MGQPKNLSPAPSAPSETVPEEVRLFPWLKKARQRLQRFKSANEERRRDPLSALRILIVTDAWKPQMNGVVRTLESLGNQLTQHGNRVRYITPNEFKTIPLPTYPEIKLALAPGRRIKKIINEFKPDAIHIATEGPLGIAARQFCIHRDHPFTTAFHTKLPEYVNARTHFPVSWGYEVQRRFHKPASAVMVTTRSMCEELSERGFKNTRLWERGVDLENFKIEVSSALDNTNGPIWLYVGRVAVEKNIEAFLDLELPGTKVVVGGGPQLKDLVGRYPDTIFAGRKEGIDLARYYSAADVFVFPSKTDTFGLVNIEALACGTPVAAYPVPGPKDILAGSKVGALNSDLKTACLTALGIASPQECREHALKFSWENCTKQFLANLAIPGYDEEYWLESANFPD